MLEHVIAFAWVASVASKEAATKPSTEVLILSLQERGSFHGYNRGDQSRGVSSLRPSGMLMRQMRTTVHFDTFEFHAKVAAIATEVS